MSFSFLIVVVVSCGMLLAVYILYTRLRQSNKKLLHELQNLRYELNTKIQPLEKKFYLQSLGKEIIVYDGRNEIASDEFSGGGAQAWDYVAHRFSQEAGTGWHQIQHNVLTINRTNTAGRYELYLKRFLFNGEQHAIIPEDKSKTQRKLRLSFEVKKGLASHLLRFVFKGEASKEVLDEKDYVVFSPEWEKAELIFTVSTHENCLLRIDDLSVMEAPSSVQLRNLELFEKS